LSTALFDFCDAKIKKRRKGRKNEEKENCRVLLKIQHFLFCIAKQKTLYSKFFEKVEGVRGRRKNFF